jgi:hypothetical protein
MPAEGRHLEVITSFRGHPRSTSKFTQGFAPITQPGQAQSWKLFLDGPLATPIVALEAIR